MPDVRTKLDCFTDGIIGARNQAKGHTFLITEFNCGWKNTAIHDGESHAYAVSVRALLPCILSLHHVFCHSRLTMHSSLSSQHALRHRTKGKLHVPHRECAPNARHLRPQLVRCAPFNHGFCCVRVSAIGLRAQYGARLSTMDSAVLGLTPSGCEHSTVRAFQPWILLC
jgi:hypothetical protein